MKRRNDSDIQISQHWGRSGRCWDTKSFANFRPSLDCIVSSRPNFGFVKTKP